MKHWAFERMSTAELWTLHLQLIQTLDLKLQAEKAVFEKRLKELKGRLVARSSEVPGSRRYPIVLPKYRNPADPSETWSGRGKTPRWLKRALVSGSKKEDFRIQNRS